MKIKNLLEDHDRGRPARRLNFNDLSAIEVAAIRGIADGRVDFENASDRMLDVLEQLKDYGLLDQNYELTQSGLKANELAIKHGSYEKRQAQQRQAQQRQTKPSPDDIPDDEGIDDDFDDRY